MFASIKEIEDFLKKRYHIGIKPGLDRIHALLEMVGNPQEDIKGIHIAGTNGKGSTVHFLRNALRMNQLQVGVFTSPSFGGLLGYIQKNNGNISEKQFLNLFNQLYPAIVRLDEKEMQPTEFEIITVIAFMYFQQEVDIAIIETGMGGREDTTNCFTPLVSVITTIDMDHMAYLGETLEQIACHKAGIIKPYQPVVVGEVDEKSYNVIYNEAFHKESILYRLHQDFSYTSIQFSLEGQQFAFVDSNQQTEVFIKVLGEHQIKNATLSLKVLKLLEKDLSLDWIKVLQGVSITSIPGRFEIVHHHPTIIIDGAHNEAGIEVLVDTVQTFYPKQQKHLIFSGFKDKELQKMISKCLPMFHSITLTTFKHPRAISMEELSEITDNPSVLFKEDWKTLLSEIKNESFHHHCYFITGSLHFITKVREYFVNK